MGELVAAIAASHVPLMETHFNDAPSEKSLRVVQSFEHLARVLRESEPDVLVVVAPDHFRTFFMDVMPPFCVGLGATVQGWGDWSLPRYELEVDQLLARALLDNALASGFDLAYSLNMRLDHGFIMPLHHLNLTPTISIVPVFVNCAAPPLPTMKRCQQLGSVIARTIAGPGVTKRVAIVASGGLSHWVPFPKVGQLETEFDQIMMDVMINGRGRVDDHDIAEKRRAGIQSFIRNSPQVNEEFDRSLLQLVAMGKGNDLADYTYEHIESSGGNGGQEIRTWMTLLGAIPERRASYTFYEPIPEWLTGVGMVAMDMSRRDDQVRKAFALGRQVFTAS
jgi:2,3-dihydroxyphenylpropionate 1,2-dioxygenase